jgi:hypothetical protein
MGIGFSSDLSVGSGTPDEAAGVELVEVAVSGGDALGRGVVVEELPAGQRGAGVEPMSPLLWRWYRLPPSALIAAVAGLLSSSRQVQPLKSSVVPLRTVMLDGAKRVFTEVN